METIRPAVLVIGGGPGGYATAIRAARLGLDTVLVQAGPLGGTCLNVGCIPSKALIHIAESYAAVRAATDGSSPMGIAARDASIDLRQAMSWKDDAVRRLRNGVGGLLRGAGVRVIEGWAELLDGKTATVATEAGVVRIEAPDIVLATGSRPVELPDLPFGGKVISSTEALSLDELPSELVVVGAGYIGLELGTAFAKLGSTVTIVEATSRVLPTIEADLAKPVAQALMTLGIRVLTEARASGFNKDEDLVVTTADGSSVSLGADRVLVTVGRAPLTEGWGLERLDLDRNGPFLAIDDRCRTSMAGVHAVGDLTGEPLLAHRAIAQGELVAELLAGRRRTWDRVCIPAVVFTDPELVTVGITAVEADAAGIAVVEGTFPFVASGKALTTGRSDGFVRIVASAEDHIVLGIHAVGSGVAELAGELALAIEMGARLEDIAATVHAHPTRTEAVQEAAMSALGMALHI